MVFCMKCGSNSYYRAAITVAVMDILYTAIILILFVLGTSLMAEFEFTGSAKNATRVLDELTEDVFGEDKPPPTARSRQPQNIAEDMGVFLIVMFLATVDFVISCIFFDGVKTRNVLKCQTWFNIRLIILVIFDIIVFINVMYGHSWYRCIPDAFLTVYRLLGILIGYAFLQELHAASNHPQCQYCLENQCIERHSVINLSGRRKEIQNSVQELPKVTVTGPEEALKFGASPSRRSSANFSPQVTITKQNSDNDHQKGMTIFSELDKDKV